MTFAVAQHVLAAAIANADELVVAGGETGLSSSAEFRVLQAPSDRWRGSCPRRTSAERLWSGRTTGGVENLAHVLVAAIVIGLYRLEPPRQ